jgi:hypothetical protein
MRLYVSSATKFKLSRKFIGIATAIAIALFITNPEIYALSVLVSSIGFDVFLLFLTFQLKDQLTYVVSLVSYFFRRDAIKPARDGSHEAEDSR